MNSFNQDPFLSVDESDLGVDLMLTGGDAEEGGDLDMEGLDLLSVSGLDYYNMAVMRRLETPKGSLERYIVDVTGVRALDGAYGSDYRRTLSEPSGLYLFETIRQNLETSLQNDPLVDFASVRYYVNRDDEVIFEVKHAPKGSVAYTSSYLFENQQLTPIN